MSYILRRQNKTKYYQNYYNWYRDTYHLPNVQVIGYPTFNNQYVVGGISSTSHLKLPTVFNPGTSTSWEMQFKVKTGSNVTAEQYIYNTEPHNVIAFSLYTNSKLSLWLSSNGTSWNLASMVQGTTVFTTNTWYWIKLVFDGKTYQVFLSTTGIYSTTPEISITSSTLLYSNATVSCFGIITTDYTNYPWLGSIDLSEYYIKINGEYWWKGVATSTPAPTFVQPNLTTYGSLSTDQFACAFSSVHSANYEGWRLFNTTSTGNGNCWATSAQPTEESPQVVVWGGVNYMNVKNIQIVNRTGTANYCTAPSAGYVQVSNDNVNWITLKSFTNSNNNWGESWDISLADNNYYYKYYRLYITASHETTINYMCIQQINLTATVYTTRENVLVESNTRNCSKQYTGKMLLNKVQTTSDDYDVSKIEKREYVIKTDNKEYTLRIK